MKKFLLTIANGTHNAKLAAVAVGMFSMYSFFLVGTIVAVNQRKATMTDIRSTQAVVSDLEISYFNASSAIDMDKANELGFVSDPVPTFAYVNPAAHDEETVALLP